jgi:hypothetical protein
MKCACVQFAICVVFCQICLFSVENSGFISLQVLDMVLEDLKKEILMPYPCYGFSVMLLVD